MSTRKQTPEKLENVIRAHEATLEHNRHLISLSNVVIIECTVFYLKELKAIKDGRAKEPSQSPDSD